jgi:nucleotide-binding universal stress UspA family protein
MPRSPAASVGWTISVSSSIDDTLGHRHRVLADEVHRRLIPERKGLSMPRVRRILHPSDFSRASTAAFRRAVDMAKTNRAELLLLHVLEPVVAIPLEGYISPKVYQDLEVSGRAAAQKQLGALVAKARKAGVKATSVLLDGFPADQIARAARSRRADVVVIGTHGRTGVSRFFMGSVASRVVALAHCPVLTVRGK